MTRSRHRPFSVAILGYVNVLCVVDETNSFDVLVLCQAPLYCSLRFRGAWHKFCLRNVGVY